MLKAGYPNLQLLEYRTVEVLTNDKSFLNLAKERGINRLDLDVLVFSQVWRSPNAGFEENDDIPEGDLFKEYTTVFRESQTNTWVVFFGANPCYRVSEPSRYFYEDLFKRQMVSLKEAHTRYLKDKTTIKS